MNRENIRRYSLTAAAFLLGSCMVGGWLQANVQEWAKANGQDQYLVNYAGPAMDKLATLAQNPIFIAITWVVVGGAIFLWLEFAIRRLLGTNKVSGAGSWPANYKPEVIIGKTFSNQRVPLDDKHYIDCRFERITFNYNGTTPIRLGHNEIVGVPLLSTECDAVFGTLMLMKGLGFMKPEIEQNFRIFINNELVDMKVESPQPKAKKSQ